MDELVKDLAPALPRILKGYVDLEDQPVDHCALVSIVDREPSWNLGSEEHDRVAFAVAVLCLAALAKNNYFGSVGCYSNAAQFKLYWQQFRVPVEALALRTRRREGSTLAGGYEHGQVKFSIPVQCPRSEQPVCIDENLISGIEAALKAGSSLIARLRAALPFFNLANTDDETLPLESEVVLSAMAFELLLEPPQNGARWLAKALGEVFQAYGKMTAGKAKAASRPGIQVEAKYEEAQKE